MPLAVYFWIVCFCAGTTVIYHWSLEYEYCLSKEPLGILPMSVKVIFAYF